MQDPTPQSAAPGAPGTTTGTGATTGTGTGAQASNNAAAQQLLRRMFDAAVASAQPAHCVPPHLPDPARVRGRLIVIGAGKASAAMAQAVEKHWPGPLAGLVMTWAGVPVIYLAAAGLVAVALLLTWRLKKRPPGGEPEAVAPGQ